MAVKGPAQGGVGSSRGPEVMVGVGLGDQVLCLGRLVSRMRALAALDDAHCPREGPLVGVHRAPCAD